MKLSRNKIEKLLKSVNQSRKKSHSKRAHSNSNGRRHPHKNRRAKSLGHEINGEPINDDNYIRGDGMNIDMDMMDGGDGDSSILSDDDMVFPSKNKNPRRRKAHTERAGKRPLNLRVKSLKRHRGRSGEQEQEGGIGEDEYAVPIDMKVSELYELLYKILYGDLCFMIPFNKVPGLLTRIQDSTLPEDFKQLSPYEKGKGPVSATYPGNDKDTLLSSLANTISYNTFYKKVFGMNPAILEPKIYGTAVYNKSQKQHIGMAKKLANIKTTSGTNKEMKNLNMLMKINTVYQNIQPQDYYYAIKDKAFSTTFTRTKDENEPRKVAEEELNKAKAQLANTVKRYTDAMLNRDVSFSKEENKGLDKINGILNERHGRFKTLGLFSFGARSDTITKDMDRIENGRTLRKDDKGIYQLSNSELNNIITNYATSSKTTSIIQLIKGPDNELKDLVKGRSASIFEILRFISRYLIPEASSKVKDEAEVEDIKTNKGVNDVVTNLEKFKKNIEMINSPLYNEDDDQVTDKTTETENLYSEIVPAVQKFIGSENKDIGNREEVKAKFDAFTAAFGDGTPVVVQQSQEEMSRIASPDSKLDEEDEEDNDDIYAKVTSLSQRPAERNAKVNDLEKTVNELIRDYKESGTITDEQVRISTLSGIQEQLQVKKIDIDGKIKDAAYINNIDKLKEILQKIKDNERTYATVRDAPVPGDGGYLQTEVNDDDIEFLSEENDYGGGAQNGGSNLKTSSLTIDKNATDKKAAIKVKTDIVDNLIKALKNLKSNATNTNGIESLNEIKKSVTTINVILKEWENELNNSKVGGYGQGNEHYDYMHYAGGQGYEQYDYMQSGGTDYKHFTNDINNNFTPINTIISVPTTPPEFKNNDRMWQSIKLNFSKYEAKKKALDTAAADVDAASSGDIIAKEKAVADAKAELEKLKTAPAPDASAATPDAAVIDAENELKTAQDELKTAKDALQKPSAPTASETKGSAIQIERIKPAIAELKTAGETLVKSVDVLIRTLGGTVEKPKVNLADLLKKKVGPLTPSQRTSAKSTSPDIMKELQELKEQVEELQKNAGKTDKIGDNESAIRAVMMGQNALAHKIKFLVDIPKWQQYKVIEEGVNTMEEQNLGLILDSLKTEIDDLMVEIKGTEKRRFDSQQLLKGKLDEVTAQITTDKDGKKVYPTPALQDLIQANTEIIGILELLLANFNAIKTKKDALIDKVLNKPKVGGAYQVGGEGCTEVNITVVGQTPKVKAWGKFTQADADAKATVSPFKAAVYNKVKMYISSTDDKFDELNTKLQSSKEDFVKLIKEIITEGGLVAFEKEEDCNTFMEEPVVESEEVITKNTAENTGNQPPAKNTGDQIPAPAPAPNTDPTSGDQSTAQNTDPTSAQNTPPAAATPVDPKHPINPATYAPLTVDVNNIDGAISEIETKIEAIKAQNALIDIFLNKGKGPAQVAQVTKGGKGKSGSTQHKQRRHGDKKSTRRKRKNYRGGVLTPAEEARLGEVTQNLNVVTKKFDRIKLLHEKGFMKGLEDNKIIVEIKKTEKEKAKLEAEKAKLEAEKAKGEEPSIGHAATTIIGTLPGVATAKAFTNATVEATQATIQTVDEIEKGPEEGASAADENVVDTDPSAAGTDPNASSAADTDPSAADTTPLDPVVATKEAEILATEMVNLDKELEKSDSVPSGVGPEEEETKPPGTGEKGDGTPGTVGDGPPGTGPGTGDGPTSTGEKNEDKDKFLPEILKKLEEIGIVDNSDSKGANQMSVEVNLETAKKTYKEFNDFIQKKEKEENTNLQTIFEDFNKVSKEGEAKEGEEGEGEGEEKKEDESGPKEEKKEEASEAEPASEAAPKKEEEKKGGGSKRRHKTKRKSTKRKSAKHNRTKSAKHRTTKRKSIKHRTTKRKSIKRKSIKRKSTKV